MLRREDETVEPSLKGSGLLVLASANVRCRLLRRALWRAIADADARSVGAQDQR